MMPKLVVIDILFIISKIICFFTIMISISFESYNIVFNNFKYFSTNILGFLD